MYPDFFYEFIGESNFIWTLIALAFAAFDYVFNLTLSFFIGGITSASAKIKEASAGRKARKTKKSRNKKTALSLAEIGEAFSGGGIAWIRDYLSDKMALVWPVTVLALPILIYGIGRGLIHTATQSLSEIGIDISLYHILPGTRVYWQYAIWVFAVLYTIRSFYRYHVERSEKTFFSKSVPFHVLRNLFIILPLTFIIASFVVVWVDFSLALYNVFVDGSIRYEVLHPDLMYGYKTVYKTVLFMGASLILASFLPAIVLTREKGQKYHKIYSLGLYTALILVLLSAGILIYRFSERLGAIQTAALQEAAYTYVPGSNDAAAGLQYFELVSSLPDRFIFPPFLTALLSTRTILIVYEIYRILNPRKERRRKYKKGNRILSRKTGQSAARLNVENFIETFIK